MVVLLAVVYMLPPADDGAATAGVWGLAVISYVLQGGGRGIFESVNKGLTIDCFPGRAPSAFANLVFWNAGSTALAFLVFPFLSTAAVLTISGVAALLTVPAVLYAANLKVGLKDNEPMAVSAA